MRPVRFLLLLGDAEDMDHLARIDIDDARGVLRVRRPCEAFAVLADVDNLRNRDFERLREFSVSTLSRPKQN